VAIALTAALLAGPAAVAGAAAGQGGADPGPTGNPSAAAPGDVGTQGLRLPDLAMAGTRDLRVIASRGHEQLRFTSTVVNIGQGPLVVNAQRSAPGRPWEVVQQILGADGSVKRRIPLRVDPIWGGDGHNHWHVPGVARYRLLRLDDGKVVAANHKIGFCFFDNTFYHSLPQTPRHRGFPNDAGCAHGRRSATSLRMGLSVGFGDVYRWRLPGQSIDITGLPTGRYRLEGKANGDELLYESDATNNLDWVDLQLIRGHRAATVKIIGHGSSAQPDDTDRGVLVLGGSGEPGGGGAEGPCSAEDPAAVDCARRG